MTQEINAAAFDEASYEPTKVEHARDQDGSSPPPENEITWFYQRATKQVKTFEQKHDGTIVCHAFESAFRAKPLVYIVRDLLELYLFLRWAEGHSGSVVLRGKPLVIHRKVRRLLHSKNGKKATFEDAPRSWLCIDIDTLPMPSGLSYACPADLAEYAVSRLPQAHFWNVSYVWQLSSSANLKNSDLIKMHLWFWLDAPRSSADLRGWAKSLGGLIDPALFNPVQPHITARPIFVGMEDPFKTRTELVLRKDQAVRRADQLHAPPPPAAPRERHVRAGRKATTFQPWNSRGNGNSLNRATVPGGQLFAGWPAILDDIERTQNFHSPIWRLLLSYYARGGSDITDLKVALRREIAVRNTSNRSDVNDRYLSDEYLDDQIASAIEYIKHNVNHGIDK